jgi:hypothetical protein
MNTTFASAGAAALVDNAAPRETSALFFLRICRGKTRYPVRPVPAGEFLIGGGEECDLRLGGLGMPALHSVIRVTGPEAVLETVLVDPPLLVNGQVASRVSLEDGDRIQIGSIEFVAQRAEISPDGTDSCLEAPENGVIAAGCPAVGNSLERELSRMTAAQLVELIEAEERQVAEFEGQRRAGAQNLLQEALRRAGGVAESAANHSSGSRSRTSGKVDTSERTLPPAVTLPFSRKSTAQTEDQLAQDLKEVAERLEDLAALLRRHVVGASDTSGGHSGPRATLADGADLVDRLGVVLNRMAVRQSRENVPELATA